jgi:hypothetical protein
LVKTIRFHCTVVGGMVMETQMYVEELQDS